MNKHLCDVLDVSGDGFNSEEELDSILNNSFDNNTKQNKTDKFGYNSPTFNDMRGSR